MKQYTQQEMEELIKTYNTIDRGIIKQNLKICMIKYKFSNKDITDILGFKKAKVDPWTNSASNNIPKFEDALSITNEFSFGIDELIEKI